MTRVQTYRLDSAYMREDVNPTGKLPIKIDRDATIRAVFEHSGYSSVVVTTPVLPSGEWREFRVSQGDPVLAEGECWAGSWSFGQRLWHLIELPRAVEVVILPPTPEPPETQAPLIGLPKRRGRPPKVHASA